MPQADNFPAMLKTGEYVLRKEAVDEIGKDKLDMMNNVDRLGYVSGGLVPEGSNGHSAIDELLALNTLSSQRNVDMTRDTGMYDDGGSAKDPLEISARQMMGAQGDIDGIGIRDTTSLKSILNDLNRMQLDYKTMERQRSRYPDEKSFKDYKNNRIEAGDSMGLEEIVKILSRAAGATQQMPSTKDYNEGGYSYGSGTTEMPDITDIFSAYGEAPTSSELADFTKNFTYDPSEEETTIGQYKSNVKGIRNSAADSLLKNSISASTAGGGFSGFGERNKMISDGSSFVNKKANMDLSDSSRNLYSSIKSMREDYIGAGIAALSTLDDAGQTINYNEEPTYEEPDANSSLLPGNSYLSDDSINDNLGGGRTFNQEGGSGQGQPNYNPGGMSASGSTAIGTDGQTYLWNGRSWELQQ